MAIALARQTLAGWWRALLLMSAGLFALELILPATYTAFGGEEGIGTLLRSLPPALQTLIQAEPTGVFGARGYLAVGYTHPIFVVINAAFLIAFAASSLAGEIGQRTALLLLARPIPRHVVVLARFAAFSLGASFLLTIAVSGTAIALAANASIQAGGLGSFLLVGVNAMLLVLALGACCFLLSAVSSELGQAAVRGVILVTGMFFLDFLAQLWHAIDVLGPLSLFHYYRPPRVLHEGALRGLDVAVLASVGGAALAVATVAFRRRDLRV